MQYIWIFENMFLHYKFEWKYIFILYDKQTAQLSSELICFEFSESFINPLEVTNLVLVKQLNQSAQCSTCNYTYAHLHMVEAKHFNFNVAMLRLAFAAFNCYFVMTWNLTANISSTNDYYFFQDSPDNKLCELDGVYDGKSFFCRNNGPSTPWLMVLLLKTLLSENYKEVV